MRREWLPAAAERLARRAGVGALSGRHWQVIAAAREDAARRGGTAPLSRLEELTGLDAGELQRLFPGDTETLIARLSGLAVPSADRRARVGCGHEED